MKKIKQARTHGIRVSGLVPIAMQDKECTLSHTTPRSFNYVPDIVVFAPTTGIYADVEPSANSGLMWGYLLSLPMVMDPPIAVVDA